MTLTNTIKVDTRKSSNGVQHIEPLTVSVIIPTFNEESNIGELITYITFNGQDSLKEIIVVDGGSTDQTVNIAKQSGATIIISDIKKRSTQMNKGALQATGNILYFLHADTYPPKDFISEIRLSIEKGSHSGCYRLSFDNNHWFLRLNCWFTRFDIDTFRFGDQSLFIKRALFFTIGGFNERLTLMEDQEIINRIKREGNFEILNSKVITSARKYIRNGVFKLQFLFLLINFFYKLKVPQKIITKFYNFYIK